jgi:hypothetical protein
VVFLSSELVISASIVIYSKFKKLKINSRPQILNINLGLKVCAKNSDFVLIFGKSSWQKEVKPQPTFSRARIIISELLKDDLSAKIVHTSACIEQGKTRFFNFIMHHDP